MPPRNSISVAASFYLGASTNFLLPFLYQTRTLQFHLSHYKHWKGIIRGRADRNFSTTPANRTATYNQRSHYDIPFEDSGSPGTADETVRFFPSRKKPGVRESTITAAEQAVFDRIFKDISRSAQKEVFAKDKTDPELDEIIYDNEGDLYQDINEMFEHAVKQQKVFEENHAASVLRSSEEWSYLEENRTRLLNQASLHDGNLGTSSLSEKEFKTITDMHRAHESSIIEKIEASQTDIELWNVLESEIFALVEVLKKRNKDEKSRQAALPLQKTKVEGKKRRQKRGTDLSDLTKTNVFPPSVLLSILQHNYSHYCLHVLRLLRREFPTSPYALNLLPAIKHLGPVSYVLGASPALYNEILFLKWTQYTDLEGMADLLEEMRNQGVEINSVTIKILLAVAKDRNRALCINNGTDSEEIAKAWWRLKGVRESWERLQLLMTDARRELHLRERMEQEQQPIDDDDNVESATSGVVHTQDRDERE